VLRKILSLGILSEYKEMITFVVDHLCDIIIISKMNLESFTSSFSSWRIGSKTLLKKFMEHSAGNL
jgi:hypothetical protein